VRGEEGKNALLCRASTLETFLRAFTLGHVRQLDKLLTHAFERAWKAGAGPGDGRLVIDVDSFIGEVCGPLKQGAGYGYTKRIGLAAVAGLLVAAALTTAASSLSGQSIGLSSEPLSAGKGLAPTATATATASPERTARPTRTPTPRPQRTRTPRPTAVPTRTAVPTVDDDNSSRGRGRGRGRGGGDDD
jgi:hypothetical protein